MATRTDHALVGRLDGLQLGRAVAALTVVIGHAVDHAYHHQVSWMWQLAARYGVTLFFVISGFIMVQTTGTGAFSPGKFLDRRIRRVVPIYWLVTLLVAFLALVAPALFQRTTFDVQHLVFSLLFIPMYDPAGTGGIWPMFRLGWTLNYEMFFYLAFAATFALSATGRAIALTLFFGALAVLGQAVELSGAIPIFYTRIDTLGFVAGVWLGVCQIKGLLRPSAAQIGVLVALSTAMLAYVALNYYTIRDVPATQAWLIAACTAHVAVLLLLVDARKWGAPRPLLFLGDASYSMYLFHMFTIGAASAVARRLPEVLMLPAVAGSAVVGITTGVLAYLFVEKPLNTLMRGKRPLTAAQIGEEAPRAPRASFGEAG